MVIKGLNNQTVELKITNYQFPESLDRDLDGNWLNIYLKVDSVQGKWQTVDPSLTTWEVQDLIDWFKDLSCDSNPKWNNTEFTEPNISFHLLNDFKLSNKKIRIKFNLESRPNSAKDDNDYYVDFVVDNMELRRIASELTTELEKYPLRK
jgi:hypothetical protein